MSEPIWCNVTFKVPVAWCGEDGLQPPAFVTDAAEALINGDGPDVDREWDPVAKTYTAPLPSDHRIWSVHGEGNYGLNDSDLEPILAWCQEVGVPYRATEDAKYEYVGEFHLFDGKEEHTREHSESGVVLAEHEWQAIVTEHAGAPFGVLAAIEAHFTVPDLADCPIDHLPALCTYGDPEANEEQRDDSLAVL